MFSGMENPPRSFARWQASGRVKPCYVGQSRMKHDRRITRSVPCGHDDGERPEHDGRSWWTYGHGSHAPCCADAFWADTYGTCYLLSLLNDITLRGVYHNLSFAAATFDTKQPYHYTNTGRKCQVFFPYVQDISGNFPLLFDYKFIRHSPLRGSRRHHSLPCPLRCRSRPAADGACAGHPAAWQG